MAYRACEISARVRRGGVTDVIVRLTTDNGLVGWGEACMRCRCRLDRGGTAAMRPFVVGRDPWHSEAIARDVFRTGLWDYRVHDRQLRLRRHRHGAVGPVRQGRAASRSTACSAVRSRSEIDYFYYLAQGTPEELRAQCADGVARGYRCYYLKVGVDAAAEEAMLEAVRATVGPMARIRIDANEAWTVPEAVGLLNRWNEPLRHRLRRGAGSDLSLRPDARSPRENARLPSAPTRGSAAKPRPIR